MAYEVASETHDGHDMGIEHFEHEGEAIEYGESRADDGLYVRVFNVDAAGKRIAEIASFEPDYTGDDMAEFELDVDAAGNCYSDADPGL
jgi:hypothetical protein